MILKERDIRDRLRLSLYRFSSWISGLTMHARHISYTILVPMLLVSQVSERALTWLDDLLPTHTTIV